MPVEGFEDTAKFKYECRYCRNNCWRGKKLVICYGSNDALNNVEIDPMKSVRKLLKVFKDLGVQNVLFQSVPKMVNCTRNPEVEKYVHRINRGLYGRCHEKKRGRNLKFLEFYREAIRDDNVHIEAKAAERRIRLSRRVFVFFPSNRTSVNKAAIVPDRISWGIAAVSNRGFSL